jgi:hypothetical protein
LEITPVIFSFFFWQKQLILSYIIRALIMKLSRAESYLEKETNFALSLKIKNLSV